MQIANSGFVKLKKTLYATLKQEIKIFADGGYTYHNLSEAHEYLLIDISAQTSSQSKCSQCRVIKLMSRLNHLCYLQSCFKHKTST
jgi:hypothetical protein